MLQCIDGSWSIGPADVPLQRTHYQAYKVCLSEQSCCSTDVTLAA